MRKTGSIFRGAAIAFLALQASLFGIWTQPPTVVSNPAVSLNFLSGPVLRVAPNGNAIAVWSTGNDSLPYFEPIIQSAFYAQGFGWQPTQIVSSLELNSFDKPLYTAQGDPSIALRPDGYAVAVWEGEHSEAPAFANTIISARRVNGNWQPVEIIGDDTGDFFSTDPQVSMNETGTALAVWRAFDKDTLMFTTVRFLPFGGSWSAPFSFPGEPATEGNPPYGFINPNGDAVVVWFGLDSNFIGNIFAATYKATTNTWTGPISLDSAPGNALQKLPRCAMDASGHAVAGWIIDTVPGEGLAKAAWFNGTAWEPAVTLGASSPQGNDAANDVIVDLNGNATAVWQGAFPAYDVFASSRLPNGTWTAPQVISTPGDLNIFTFLLQEPLSVNPEGDVIAIWVGGIETYIVKTAYKPFGKDWRAPEIVSDTVEQQGYVNVGIASCGFAIALWQRFLDDDLNLALASINENLLLSEDALIAQCCQKHLSGKKCVNILTWVQDPCVVFYNIYCNGTLIATVINTGAPLSFIDQNVCRDCSYTISTVNIYGFEGEQVPFTFL